MLEPDQANALASGRHGNPFAVLGRHAQAGQWWLRACMPGAQEVAALFTDRKRPVPLAEVVPGVFEAAVRSRAAYRLRVRWADGSTQELDDPYRFPPLLGELDAWLLAEGTHLRPADVLGARPARLLGIEGVAFAVWAPNAQRVSVVGDFNAWDGRRHPMRCRMECGVWELFIPGLAAGERYKFELVSAQGELLPQKADPMARAAELRPATASIAAPLPSVAALPAARAAANAADAPISIYEVHLGSWRRHTEHGGWLNWDELSDQLISYAADMGFTHLELLPITEHPFDGSWGYQTLGQYAPTARHGTAEGLLRFVQRAHQAGLGVLLDWVPAHFPTDAHGMARFDGTPLYEYADPREGFHHDWNTLIYNFSRLEVRNFLVGSALHWLQRFAFDGLRVDAVASMLYRDYSRPAGQWLPNVHGGRENLEAIELLRRMNQGVQEQCPGAITVAEESTAFPGVTSPVQHGGLGFNFKWNMGWMHDTLQYMRREPIHRSHHHHELTFGTSYAFGEAYVLPLSHDEVVHGKGSLLNKMPGDRWQRFANLRAYYGFMWAHPGKKLLFMGGEFAQEREWNHDAALDWHLLDDPAHAGVQRLVRDLNRLLREHPALHEADADAAGFAWTQANAAQQSVLAFMRMSPRTGRHLLVMCNFTPVVRPSYRVGVPSAGRWVERLNTDSAHYGGGNVGTPLGEAQAQALPADGYAWSVSLQLPPLATVMLECVP